MPMDIYFTSKRPGYAPRIADLPVEDQAQIKRWLALPPSEQYELLDKLKAIHYDKNRPRRLSTAGQTFIHIKKQRKHDQQGGQWLNCREKYVRKGLRICGGMQKV